MSRGYEAYWAKGNIDPPESGTYHTIVRGFKSDNFYLMNDDSWDAEKKEWNSISKHNPNWEVVAWAYRQLPAIPEHLQGKVKVYFGKEVPNE